MKTQGELSLVWLFSALLAWRSFWELGRTLPVCYFRRIKGIVFVFLFPFAHWRIQGFRNTKFTKKFKKLAKFRKEYNVLTSEAILLFDDWFSYTCFIDFMQQSLIYYTHLIRFLISYFYIFMTFGKFIITCYKGYLTFLLSFLQYMYFRVHVFVNVNGKFVATVRYFVQ